MPGMTNDTDHYRNIAPSEIIELAAPHRWDQIECIYERTNCDTYFWGIKL